jgi:predicted transcriptional regulator
MDREGVTQTCLAELLCTSQQTVSLWVLAKRAPTPHYAELLEMLTAIARDDWFTEREISDFARAKRYVATWLANRAVREVA